MNKGNVAIMLAAKKGYTVTDNGTVLSPSGRIRKTQGARPKFNISIPNSLEKYPVIVHRLQAYQKYGDEVFKSGVVVRHKDDTPRNNSEDNILIGSVHDNIMDRTPEARSKHATLANLNRVDIFHDAVWLNAISDLLETPVISFGKLAKRHNIPNKTLRDRLNRMFSSIDPHEKDVFEL